MGAAHSVHQQSEGQGEHAGRGPAGLAAPQGRGAPTGSNGRVVVDIRGASLDHNYSVWIEKQPHYRRKTQEVEVGVNSVSGMLQALGGVLITALTIHKLVEEVRVMRALRRNAAFGGTAQGGAASSSSGPTQQEASQQPPAEQRLLPPPDFGRTEDASTSAASGASSGGSQAVSWRTISGLNGVKMLLQEATVLPMLRPDMFTGVRQPPKGVLLYGPPGTGKTLLARAVAAESGATFLPVTGSSVLSKWFGESEANVRRLFEEARRLAPAVVFIDEVDSMLGRRAGDGGPAGASEASRRVTNEFLSFIDGIQTTGSRIVVIAATNAPWDIDEAALSRFNARVLVPLPSREARADILKQAMQGVAVELSEPDWLAVAERADKYSGRDLMSVCREASMRPLRELWGGRILESTSGEPLHSRQHRQLVGVVCDALRRGSSPKRIRKELEKWKRTHAAAWINVDGVMTEAQQQQQQQQPGRGSSGSAAPAAAAAATQAPGTAAIMPPAASVPQAPGAVAVVSAAAAVAATPAVTGAGSSCMSTVMAVSNAAAGAVASARANCRHQQPRTSNVNAWVGVTAQQEQHESSTRTHSTMARPMQCDISSSSSSSAGGLLQRAAGHPQQQDLQASSSGGSAMELPPRAGTLTGGALLCSHAIDVEEFQEYDDDLCSSTSASDRSGSSSLAAEDMRTEAPSTSNCSQSVDGPTAVAAAAAAPPAPKGASVLASASTSSKHCMHMQHGLGTAASATAASSTSSSKGDAWTVDELLALPTESVRPVRLEDFEWALNHVASTDFDLSGKFEEWDQQYGSGGGAKREREWRHLPMYL